MKKFNPCIWPITVSMIKESLPKVVIKLFHVRILFLDSLLFVAVINPYSVLNFKFLILVHYNVMHNYRNLTHVACGYFKQC